MNMMTQEHIDCDLLVIGRGFSGMVAAARSSAYGLKTVQAGNSSSFFLHSGLIDLLGVYPIENRQVLSSPKTGIKQLKTDIPDHPYSKLDYTRILDSTLFVHTVLKTSGLEYQRHSNQNQMILTAAGTFKPSFLVPHTMAGGGREYIAGKRVLFVDFKGLKGFSSSQVAETIRPVCPGAASLTIEIPDHFGGLTPVQLAGMFEKDSFLNMIVQLVRSQSDSYDRIGFPAVCGINKSTETIKKLEKEIECHCFEILGLPPSIPGLRMRNAFERYLSNNDVDVLNNAFVSFNSYDGQKFSMTAANQNIDTRIQAKGVILCTGRFQGNGLIAQRSQIQESVFDLPVFQPEHRNQWYDREFFNPGGHLINQAGIQVDNRFRTIKKDEESGLGHLYAAGSILAHNDWMRLKSGSGVSCASAVAAVDCFHDTLKGNGHV